MEVKSAINNARASGSTEIWLRCATKALFIARIGFDLKTHVHK